MSERIAGICEQEKQHRAADYNQARKEGRDNDIRVLDQAEFRQKSPALNNYNNETTTGSLARAGATQNTGNFGFAVTNGIWHLE